MQRMAKMFNVDQLRLMIEATLREMPDLADDAMLRQDMLEGETNFMEVLAELYELSDNTNSRVDELTVQIGQRRIRRERLKRRIEFYRALMLKILQSADLKKVELAAATLSQRNGTQQLIGEPDPDALPDDLVRITREANLTAIRLALLAHRELPGLSLNNGPPTLSVRST
jgi:Siphovirus Gp157